jgi:hypothetical protein
VANHITKFPTKGKQEGNSGIMLYTTGIASFHSYPTPPLRHFTFINLGWAWQMQLVCTADIYLD